ncbi:hypothetical protein MHBO_002495 [Bonamia ostreae]|uniref:ABC transporter domain-containing protein n=1 Tax=Bonamia ostreae TaxID=126728 RepID=A0ABV2AMK4_9EUKA
MSEQSIKYSLKSDKSKKVRLSFKGLKYSVKVKKSNKIILDDINGEVCSGEVLAILGASGAGKSSFVNMLTGRVPSNVSAEGEILLNGEKVSFSNLKDITGYVLQEDLMFSHQTVQETIRFSAVLRCPSHFTQKDCDEKSEEVMRHLGLITVKDTKIGNEFQRGISGGEKKRVSIAVECVRDLSILYLDEVFWPNLKIANDGT